MSKQLIAAVADELEISKADASRIVRAVMNSIEKVVARQGNLTIVNFGSFTVKQFKRTSKLHGREYNIDKNVIRFKAGAGFVKLVN